MRKKILIVDDEPGLRLSLKRLLEEQGYEVLCVAGVQEACQLSPSLDIALAIVDLNLADGKGTDLLLLLKQKYDPIQSILITGESSINVTIVEAIKKEILYFMPKPFDLPVLLELVKKVLKQQNLEEQNKILKENLRKQFHFNRIIGQSEGILNLTEWMYKVAKSSSNLLIIGESGVGKELVARSIHCARDSARPFISVNCGAIPKELLESEFFGHRKGAFTGAVSHHQGYFEAAKEGTLFLDEIGTMDLGLQVKLLRVLQEKSFKPVGSTSSIPTKARIISATNIDLEKAVERGEFRKDLYYRLNIIPLSIPPLRKRKEDIPLLVQHFLKKFQSEKKVQALSAQALECLCEYPWPGNIRELENLIERLCVFKDKGQITFEDLPHKYRGRKRPVAQPLSAIEIPREGMDFNSAVDAYENSLLEKALQRTRWNKRRAALLLNLNRTTLIEKIKKKGLKSPYEGDLFIE